LRAKGKGTASKKVKELEKRVSELESETNVLTEMVKGGKLQLRWKEREIQNLEKKLSVMKGGEGEINTI